jgi:drug/metabolite transporter (DMT)-like permease
MAETTTQAIEKPATSKIGVVYLLIVYIVWGSTYLAIRVAVREGAGFAPFMLGTLRATTAGILLLGWSYFTGKRLRLSPKEFLIVAASGLLLWVGGNGLVTYGEQRADSGLAALMVAGVPMWVALFDAINRRKLPSLFLVAALLLGLAGIVLLSMPLILSGLRADIVSVIALVSAAITWALGTYIQARNPTSLPPAVNSGYQLLIGGIGFAVTALLTGEPLPHPIPAAWLAWAYLVVFGSLIGFTSYTQALRLLPTNIVTTYSYVNPIIAVILGSLILGEKITHWTILGAVFILLGVTGVFREHALNGKNHNNH